MERRAYLLGTVTAALAGCLDTDDDDDDLTTDDNDIEEQPDDDTDDEEPEADPGDDDDTANDEPSESDQLVTAGESHSFSGSGSSVTDEFNLSEGMAAIEFSHDGDTNFIVWMRDLGGEAFDDELLVNVIGSIDGRSMIPVGDSEYLLDIAADGEWTISLEQPAVTEADLLDLPFTAEGTGPDYVGPVRLDGVTEISGTHDGEANFIVWGRSAEGGLTAWDLAFNEIGEFEGATTTRAEGIVWFDINSDGNWTLEVGD